MKVAALATIVYTGGAAAGMWGAAEGAAAGAAGGVAGGTGLTAGAAGATGLTAGAAGTGLSTAAAGAGFDAGLAAAGLGGAAAGATALGSEIMAGLKTVSQLAPLASLAMSASQPTVKAQGVPSPTAAPQTATTPAPNIFKKKLGALGDPTKASGIGGVSDLSLGKATVLGM